MQIQNAEATAIIQKEAKLTLSEGFPQVLAATAIPVIDMSPFFHKTADIIKAQTLEDATSATIYTVPSKKYFFLTSYTLSELSSSTADSEFVAITVKVNGQTASIATLCPNQVGTSLMNSSIGVALHTRIRCDPGSPILLISQTATSKIHAEATIQGYEEDVVF
jgi:hypothetical protein